MCVTFREVLSIKCYRERCSRRSSVCQYGEVQLVIQPVLSRVEDIWDLHVAGHLFRGTIQQVGEFFKLC